MRTDLPWNVAGIPAEAREAARAAARREGLSVGEWLTRRILRSFSETAEEAPPMADNWHMPSGPSRRDTEDMLAHVTRSESQTSDLARKIEDQLRGVARRLDSAERSQSENTRAMSRAAAEINVATREQSQAFDQLAAHVLGLTERMTRVERQSGDANMKEAVKALHQGLSRLADQISQTATQSGSQVTLLAQNLEQLAERLGKVRDENDAIANMLDQRLAIVEKGAEGHTYTINRLISAFEERADARVAEQNAAAGEIAQLRENIGQFEARLADTATAEAIATLQENVGQIEARLADTATADAIAKLQDNVGQIEARLADTATAEAIARLEENVGHLEEKLSDTATAGAIAKLQDNISALESRLADPAIDRRLNGIERSLSEIVSRMDADRSNNPVEDTIRKLSHKLELVEKRQDEKVDELRSAVSKASHRLSAVETTTQSFSDLAASSFMAPAEPFNEAAFAQNEVEHTPPPFDAPPIEETSFDEPPFEETPLSKDAQRSVVPETSLEEALKSETPDEFVAGEDVAAPDSFDNHVDDAFGPPPFAPEQAGNESPFPPIAADPFVAPEPAEPPTVESYLAAARQSARAAAATAEAERLRSPLGNFSWTNGQSAEEPKNTRRPYLLLGLVGALFVVVIIVAWALSSRHESAPATDVSANVAPKAAQSSPSGLPDVVVASPAPVSAESSANLSSNTSVPAPASSPATTSPAQPASSAKTAAAPAKPAQTAALDRLTALANSGNTTAEAIVGFRYLDGDGVASSPVQAAKWLERAAEKGQPVAQGALGQMYEEGEGVAKDPVKAVRWYQSAASQGNAKAMHNLALTYVNGIGQKKDATEGVRWFLRAANLGIANSQFNLAVLYESGLGVSQSLLEAYKWYLISAAQGDKEAKARVEALRTQLNAEDRAAAESSAAGFRSARLNPKANNRPLLSDLPAN